MLCTIILALLAAMAAAAPSIATAHQGDARNIPNYPGIQFNNNKQLSITVFSDLHFGEPWEAQKRPNSDSKTIGAMNRILDIEHPNLVVLNGDLVSCEWVSPQDANGLIDWIVSPIVGRNIPFGATFGNHDASQTCSTESMTQHMWDNSWSRNGQRLSFTTESVSGPAEQVGVSNYYIPVYSSTDPTRLVMLLWFFDSRGGKVYQPGKGDSQMDDWVNEKVVSWFRNTRDQLNRQNGYYVPSLVFVHIPIQATAAFQQSNKRTEATEPGIEAELISHQGDCTESSTCWNGRDGPFMEALAETDGLMGVFSGHDHGVDWCMKWARGKGIALCFNRHSGHGGYSDWARGARQIVVKERSLTPETWIRLEDGSVSGHVTLNSTYGTDKYEKVRKFSTSDS